MRFLDLKVGPAQYGAHGESFLDRGRTPALFLLLFFNVFFWVEQFVACKGKVNLGVGHLL